jgi:hypothetical protein
MRKLNAIELGTHNGVIIVCLPPHSTHKLQLLGVSFMGPFKNYYSMEIENWMKNHPYHSITAYEVGTTMGVKYIRVATMENAINGLKNVSIFRLNPTFSETMTLYLTVTRWWQRKWIYYWNS